MNGAEWESLCDGCGRCCLNKLEDYDTGEIAWTDVACRLLDGETCRCRDYAESPGAWCRTASRSTRRRCRSLSWLPPTCGYRLVAEGRDLYWWHPLVSGDPETVHQAGISVRGRTVSEEAWPVETLEERIVRWPGKMPRGGARRCRCGLISLPAAEKLPGERLHLGRRLAGGGGLHRRAALAHRGGIGDAVAELRLRRRGEAADGGKHLGGRARPWPARG